MTQQDSPQDRMRYPSIPLDIVKQPVPSAQRVDSSRLAFTHELTPLLYSMGSGEPPTLRNGCFVASTPGEAGPTLYRTKAFFVPQRVRDQHILLVGNAVGDVQGRLAWPLLADDIRNPERSVIAVCTTIEQSRFVLETALAHRKGQPVHRLNFSDRKRSNTAWPIIDASDFASAGSSIPKISRFLWDVNSGSNPIDRLTLSSTTQLVYALMLLCQARTGAYSFADAAYALTYLSKSQLIGLLKTRPQCRIAVGALRDIEAGQLNVDFILKEARNALRVLADDDFASTTVSGQFNVESLQRTPQVLVIEAWELNRPEVLLTIAMFLESVVTESERAAVTSSQPGNKRRLRIHFEDIAATASEIRDVPQFLNRAARFGVSVTATTPTVRRLAEAFPRNIDSVCEQFGSKILQAPVEHHDANWASYLSGQTIVDLKSEVESTQEFLSNRYQVSGRSTVPAIRPVLAPGAIRMAALLPRFGRAATFFLSGHYPFQGWFPSIKGSHLDSAVQVVLHGDPPKWHPPPEFSQIVAPAR